MMSRRSMVILSSGGLGSAVAAYRLAHEECIHGLFVDYGQPAAKREEAAVRAIAETREFRDVRVVRLPHVAEFQRAMNSRAAGGFHAGGGDGLSDVVQAPLLPTLLTVAAHYACTLSADRILIGLCRAPQAGAVERLRHPPWLNDPHEFIHAANIFLETALPASAKVEVLAPLLEIAPPDLLRLARRLEVPLASTWSCDQGQELPCRACPGCKRRVGAFSAAGWEDPLLNAGRDRR